MTAPYSLISINHDDLMTLGYIMAFLASNSLPWSDVEMEPVPARGLSHAEAVIREQKFRDDILAVKEATSDAELFQ